jgi:hypothetical protein
MKQLASQKMLKYSVSDALSTQMEKDIDDLVERAAFNESQKTFQQMSQKDALQLAKDVYEFDLKATWLSKEVGLSQTSPVSRVSGTFGLGLSKLNLASWKS